MEGPTRCHRWNLPIQLPRYDPTVDVPPRPSHRKHHGAEAVRTGPRSMHDARRVGQGKLRPIQSCCFEAKWPSFQEAGIPDGCVNVIHGQHDAVNFICDNPDIQAISFVGADQAVCFPLTIWLITVYFIS